MFLPQPALLAHGLTDGLNHQDGGLPAFFHITTAVCWAQSSVICCDAQCRRRRVIPSLPRRTKRH